MKDLIVIERDGSVAHLIMQDQEGRNALSEEFVELLIHRLEEVASDPEAKVCIIRGNSDVFCSGGDKKMLLSLAQGQVAATDIMLPRAILEVPIVTIAAMEGHAVGGGLALGLCCDLVLMARESRYGCSFMNMGFTPGMGTTRLLELATGPFLAAEMMYGGEFIRGSRFESTAINYVLPRQKLLRKAESVAARIAEKPRHALELLKRTLTIRKRQAFEETRTIESAMHELSFAQEETLALIKERYEEAD
jgi:polyketide biosynthesis enoyl-CoA hydratase PksI